MKNKIFSDYRIKAILYFMFAVALILALVSYHPSDPSLNLVSNNYPQNLLTYVGSYSADFLYQIIGLSAYIIPLCLISWSMLLFIKQKVSYFWLRIFLMISAIFTLSSAIHSIEFNILPSTSGGAFGVLISKNLATVNIPYLKKEWIQLSVSGLAIISLIGALAIPIKLYIKIFASLYYPFAKLNIFSKILNKVSLADSGEAYYASEGFGELSKQKTSNEYSLNTKQPESYKEQRKKTTPQKHSRSLSNIEELALEELPSVELLDDISGDKIKQLTKAELDENAEKLIKVLNDFGVKGNMLNIRQGPVVTLYEFEPAAGTKSSRVIGLADDIARSLSALSTRISVIPGRNALGIELPNKNRSFFRLRELIQTEEFQNKNLLLPLILGKDLGGQPYIADLAKMPHLLVAGTTGSGKSVAINAMIMSLLYRYSPEECKMIMIDPKMLELSAYDNIPHLLTPVVTEPGKAVVALKWAVKEMENRYRLMSHFGVRNIANYNSKIEAAIKSGETLERTIQTGFDPQTGKPIEERVPVELVKMPFIVVIVDEMADLMIVAGKDIESSIQRLAQMARAAGIHIIMATQRPSVDVITGVIKANFPSRISFRVTSKIDARTILGEQGSEQLLGMGDMLFMGSSSNIIRVHGPFVDDAEVERVTDYLRKTGAPQYVSAVTEANEDESFDEMDSDGNNEADMYNQAVSIVKTHRKASISYIQRCLRIGYNRAANLVEEMERKGVLSSPNHSGKREILLPEE